LTGARVANHFETEMGRPRELVAPSLLLLLAESPGHGYELMERLRPLGFDWGGPGPIYRELRSLEDAGLIVSDWFVGQSGPVRRVYEITPSGRDSLDRSIAGILGLRRLIAEYQVRLRAIAPPRPLPASGARRRRPALTSRNGGSS
jgi:DNA-binding PadR family transcriptional regulator